MTLMDRITFAGAVVRLATVTLLTVAAFLVLVTAPVLIVAQYWM